MSDHSCCILLSDSSLSPFNPIVPRYSKKPPAAIIAAKVAQTYVISTVSVILKTI